MKLLLAHLAGDFLFQPDKWVNEKKKRKGKSKYLYKHIGIHLLLLLIIFQLDFSYWAVFLFIPISHYLIDWLKLLIVTKENQRIAFFIDQILHLIVIALMTYYYNPYTIFLNAIYAPKLLLFITVLLMLTVVSSVLIKILLSSWKVEDKSLYQAGKYIGMLERLFIFGFMLINYWAGIGFLLTAKSVFRFNDLSKVKDRQLTEYILLGTFLSFGLAILCAIGYDFMLAKLNLY